MSLPDLAGSLFIGQDALLSSGLLAFRSPDFLPDPLASLLFETQWGYWLLGFAVAAILFYAGQHRARKGMAVAGIIIAALTLVWILLASLLDTPRERLYHAHNALAAAAEKGDIDAMLSFMTDEFECRFLGVAGIRTAKTRIADSLKRYGVKGSKITHFKPHFSGPYASTDISLSTNTDWGPVRTSWNLQWDDIPSSDWKIRVADLKTINDHPAPSIEQFR